LQHFGDDQLVVIEQAADFLHALHQRPVDDVERCQAVFQLLIKVWNESFFCPFDDVVGQAFVDRQVGDRLLDARRGVAEMLRGAGNVVLVDARLLLPRLLAVVARRVVALGRIVPQQIFGEFFLGVGDRRVAFELFGVDDRQVEPRPCRVIEKMVSTALPM
jgi:hypothetical protein